MQYLVSSGGCAHRVIMNNNNSLWCASKFWALRRFQRGYSDCAQNLKSPGTFSLIILYGKKINIVEQKCPGLAGRESFEKN